ncbi:MAG: YbhB/YbcL family Raf kinase inhibitor-like protein [Candidatus Thorarchaeota archaeon]|nr:YbhB/YbcL family Raf kinase inhibitor-like protein [Candidatus Thorarchaeota archaeon]
MKLWSNDFEEGQPIPARCSYRNENINPHIGWDDAPENTQSFALICNDPDAPVGDWIHWLLHGIPSGIREIPSGGKVPGVEVQNDFGVCHWGGPAPPFGTHRYFFTIYALSVPALENVHKNNFRELCEKHKLAVAQTMGTYTRK